MATRGGGYKSWLPSPARWGVTGPDPESREALQPPGAGGVRDRQAPAEGEKSVYLTEGEVDSALLSVAGGVCALYGGVGSVSDLQPHPGTTEPILL